MGMRTEWDQTGMGPMPATQGNHDEAREWLGLIYESLIQRMPGGTTVSQLQLSTSVRKKLAGAGGDSADPMHLAALFWRLHAAGTSMTNGKPFQKTAEPRSNPGSSRGLNQHPVVDLDKKVRDELMDMAEENAPTGIDRQLLEKAVFAVNAQRGETLREKQVEGFRGLARGRARDSNAQERDTCSEAHLTAAQGLKGQISLAVEAIETADLTRGNAIFMNLQSRPMQLVIQAILTRQFTSTPWALSRLVPRTPGAPTTVELAEAFGEADKCVMDGTVRTAGSEARDRRMYPYLRTAVINMGILDIPSLDFGFVSATVTLAKDIQSFEANGVPMAAVTRDICKFLLNALRRRDQDLSSFPSDPGATMVSYKDTDALRISRAGLLEVTRETQADDQSRFQEMLQKAIESGLMTGTPKREKPPKAADKQLAPEGFTPKAGPKLPPATPGAKVKKEKTDDGHPLWNAIDQNLWREHYGNERTGLMRKLCYFHANRPGGCVKTSDCEWDHAVPGRYGGKQFSELSIAKAEFVVKQCTKP